jgi:hypothetical protein
MHLAELGKPDVLDTMLPGLGRGWSEMLAGSQNNIFGWSAAYTMQWEAVAARWAHEDYTFLQPALPCWIMPLVYVISLLKGTVAKKQLELCAPSPPSPFPQFH